MRLVTETPPPATALPPAHPTADVVPAQRGHRARTTLQVRYLAMPHTVARLDTTHPEWVLYLDTDSPAEDHCWALLDVLRIVTLGVHAASSTTPPPLLHLVGNDDTTARNGPRRDPVNSGRSR